MKITSFALLTGFFLFLSTDLFGQAEPLKLNGSTSRNIHLTDGSILKGRIITTDTLNNLVHIELDSGGEISIPTNTIAHSKKQKGSFNHLSNGKSIKEKGFYFLPQLYSLSAKRAQSWDDGNKIRHAVGASFTAGYQLKNYLAIGIGSGLEAYEELMMPVFLDIRGNIGKGNFTPYYALGLGYGLPLGEWIDNDTGFDEKFKGGKFIYPAIGIKFASRNALAFQMDIGYNFQQNEREVFRWWGGNGNIEKIWYKSLAIRLGVSF